MRSEGGGCGCRVDRKRRPGFVRREKRRDRAQAMCRALESWSDGWISRCSVSRRTAGASTAVCGSLRFLRPGSRRPFANTSKRKSHRASAPPFLLGLVGVKIRARSSWKCPRWHARGRSLPSFPTLSWSLPPELAFCPKRRPAFRPLNSFRRGLYYPELSCSAVFGASRCRHLVRILVPGGLGPGPPFRIASGSHPRSARSSQRRLSIIGPRPSLYGSPWSCFVPHEIIALEKGKSLRNTFSTTHHEEVKHKNEGQRQENTNAGGADKRETATREARDRTRDCVSLAKQLIPHPWNLSRHARSFEHWATSRLRCWFFTGRGPGRIYTGRRQTESVDSRTPPVPFDDGVWPASFATAETPDGRPVRNFSPGAHTHEFIILRHGQPKNTLFAPSIFYFLVREPQL